VSKKLSTEQFIQKSKEIHNNFYNYSNVIYITSFSKVCIICPIHGKFQQTASSHLRGKGCPKCANEKRNQKTKITCSDFFIEKANKIHNNKYDYSKVEYINAHTKVRIICPVHGEFLQSPNKHLVGRGCPKCSKHYKPSTNEFIQNSQQVHIKGTYDYSKVKYINNRTKVRIICPVHGEFLQSPNKHLAGKGCQKCNSSKGEIKVEQWLKEKNIKFVSQKRFKNCRGKKLPLPFDFYLPEYNTCIEFDGEQHFEPVKRFGGLLSFQRTQLHDNIKTRYCLENNISLLRIPYNKIKKIEKILKDFLN